MRAKPLPPIDGTWKATLVTPFCKLTALLQRGVSKIPPFSRVLIQKFSNGPK